MKIVLLGSGNVATHIGRALQQGGHEVVQVYSRTISNAQALADALGCEGTDDIRRVQNDADAYIFSVKDDALPQLADDIICHNADAVFIHTAGSVSINVFNGHAQRYGVLYPLQTFSKSREVNFREVPCFIEGCDVATLNIIDGIARSISNRVVDMSSDKRKSLHIAAVFACNFTNHCYRLAERVLTDAGIDFSLSLPLIDMTARKVHDMSPSDAQTGPAIRYDETVINRHLNMLTDDTMRQIYRLMSQSIHTDSLA